MKVLEKINHKIQDIYSYLHDNKTIIRKWIIILSIIVSLYFLIDSYTNYDFDYFILHEIYILLVLFALYIIAIVFHKLFGKWLIHKKNLRLTVDYVSLKMPRSIKVDGHRGTGKDSTVNAIRKIFQRDMEEIIKLEIEMIEMVCYPYDFKLLNSELDNYNKELMTNSKNDFFNTFKKILIDNDCFIKPVYKKDFSVEKHLEDFNEIKRDPFNPEINKTKYKYNNGITIQHYINLLIKYSIGYIRLNYLNSFLITNQPMLENDDLPAKMFSTRFTNIQKDNSEWPWPLDGRFIINETESDAFYPNVGVKKGDQPMQSGLRNFKAFFRHFFGEESVWINIGQRASRTNKQLRELDHAFITIIEQSKVYGGEKRIYFLDKFLSWVNFWVKHSIRNKAAEKQIKRRSKIYELVRRLENSGYIYVDIKVSRDDLGGKAEEMTIKKILRHDKKIYENYKVKLCFKIIDCYRGYNTYYLESLAEIMANKSKMTYKDMKSWGKDLILKKKDMEYMGYSVLDDVLGGSNEKKK
ncbi:MAG: hypothetical protein AB7E09_00030 [Candidatus Izemoplasmatales bacterium]